MTHLIRRFKMIIKEIIEFFRGNKFLEVRSSAVDFKKAFELLRPFNPGFSLIRVGGLNDGGYLIPDDLEEIEMCISPGFGHNTSFEDSLYSQFKIKSTIIDLLPEPENFPESFTYLRRYLGLETSPEFLELKTVVNNLDKSITGDLVLQMDIEGSEYLSLLSTPQSTLNRFRIIVIELHYLERLKNGYWIEQIVIPFLKKITSNHTICHTHPNNAVAFFDFMGMKFPRVVEITLLRNDRFEKELLIPAVLPNALDRPNKPQNPNLFLDFSTIEKLI